MGVLLARGDRPREFVVEEHAPAARGVGGDGVEHLPAVLVLVETLVYQVPQEPAALGPAPGIGFFDTRSFRQGVGVAVAVLLFVAQERHQIPDGCEAQAQHQRALGLVHQLVDGARNESSR